MQHAGSCCMVAAVLDLHLGGREAQTYGGPFSTSNEVLVTPVTFFSWVNPQQITALNKNKNTNTPQILITMAALDYLTCQSHWGE